MKLKFYHYLGAAIGLAGLYFAWDAWRDRKELQAVGNSKPPKKSQQWAPTTGERIQQIKATMPPGDSDEMKLAKAKWVYMNIVRKQKGLPTKPMPKNILKPTMAEAKDMAKDMAKETGRKTRVHKSGRIIVSAKPKIKKATTPKVRNVGYRQVHSG